MQRPPEVEANEKLPNMQGERPKPNAFLDTRIPSHLHPNGTHPCQTQSTQASAISLKKQAITTVSPMDGGPRSTPWTFPWSFRQKYLARALTASVARQRDRQRFRRTAILNCPSEDLSDFVSQTQCFVWLPTTSLASQTAIGRKQR